MTTRERLFGWQHAFDHPVSVWIVAAVGAMLLLTPLILIGLGAAGRLTDSSRKELWTRYLSWLVLVPLMGGPVLLGAAWTIAAVGVLSLLCYREFARATGLFRERLVSAVVVVGILLVTFSVIDHWYDLFVALFPLTVVLIAAVAIVEDRPKGYIQRTALGIFAFAFFGSCYGHLGYIANDADYRPLVLTLLLTVELNDVFAYISGRLFGRRKLAPNTSPKKTWAGSIGSVALTTPLVAVLGHYVFQGTPVDHWLHLTALGLIVSVGGQFGDLMLSSIKRDLGIKDFAATIPGHGGLLDRFDSLILVAPAVFHYVGHLQGIGPMDATRIITGGR
jgi:phosphatidate cytidylyltransferase